MMLAYGACASIISTIGAPFLCLWAVTPPDAPDALLLRPPKPRKKRAVPSVFQATLKNERVSDALPRAPNEKRRSDDG